ncbi:cobalamin biosynthesis protein [Nocardia sp. CDC160]|uniref:cobalamin biosynthesis protein n=1 Tax=Nocardia sp. CDC160 TaxID=3112166 RepID=UPI002DBC5A4A|nr:cobalamin biosynthesis protein [Nocardia sp. CDC160]MEC3915919.1 cobalamin biosynthesis protein [Nocardia sp. CDC160]
MKSRRVAAVGLLLGFGMDRVFGDPRRGHPVAGFGALAMKVEGVTYRNSRAAGVIHEVVLVGAVAGLGVGLQRIVAGSTARRSSGRRSAIRTGAGGATTFTRAGSTRRTMASALGEIALTAAATWTVLGGTTLAKTGRAMADRLEAGDIDGARELLPSLCGRDPEVLDADGLARAALESIAENTSDATVAPLVWGAMAGVPGLLAYRAVNTLDAMVGYRNERYNHFGWAAARTDDMANLIPARVSGLITVALAPIVGGRPADAWQAWHRDAAKHPSPNAGVAEASMAGALGVRLGGKTQYRHGVELRPTLGDGPAPRVHDLRRAVRLSEAVQIATALAAAAVAYLRRR